MSVLALNPSGIERGQYGDGGHLTKLLGLEFYSDNIRSLATTGVQTKQDERKVKMQLVKNGSGGALLPGQLVANKTLLGGTDVTNPAATAGVAIAGVVDPLLPAAGVPDGKHFLIIIDGPAQFLVDANAAVVEFDALINSASVAGCVRSGTTSGAIVGRAEAAANAGGGAIGTATTVWGVFRRN